ncbi:acetate/propionate family kinase [Pseudooceanicola sp. LIPI14-2-Ac024]|uniref:acetate/propionate family kinase n=1 Tax=Pseudooceanicola sp. LIPI14-2-Ac024 TaxID=3344875 RepID=UPI0035CEDE55
MSHILVLNAGSSSIKFGLFTPGDAPGLIGGGMVERAHGDVVMHVKDGAGYRLMDTRLPDPGSPAHDMALRAILQALETHFGHVEVATVGHRIVHGGLSFAAPVELTEDALETLAGYVSFAPLHQPHNLAGVRAAQAAFPRARQIGCFDTAFHRNHPFVNDTFALPRAYYDRGVRRYGFHGLSYDYITGHLADTAPDLHAGRVVVAHLGNGASMCGIRAGRSIASSMGFTALDGLPMGTRSGQIDPGVLLYLIEQEGMTPAEVSDLLNRRSGLLGMSGISADMRTLLASDNPRAREAIDYFTFRIRRELGGMAAALEGIDALVFTGGIGENAAQIRAEVCAGLGWIGIEVDETANADGATRISPQGAAVEVLVIPTNEELVIARAAARV